jgi:site-specific DNA recombinase
MAADSGLLTWAARSGCRRGGGRAPGGLRFVFYGRVSTEDWQDPESSRARQREEAGALTRGHGVIVEELFDIGESRAVAWGRRPQAAALIAALADPGRGWDAIVVGGVRARVLRLPVRADGAAVRALRSAAVDAGGGRPGRLQLGA